MIERLALSCFHDGVLPVDRQQVVGAVSVAKHSQIEREQRVAQIVGDEFMANALYVEHESAGCKLTGWLCQPTYARAQPDLQHFYLNGRMLRDRVVASAIRLGYRDVMFHGRQPAYVLFMEIDPTQVDVNAHPAKLEVRFRDGRHVHDFLFRSVERVLRDTYAGASGALPAPASISTLMPSVESRLFWPAQRPQDRYRWRDHSFSQSSLGLRVAETPAPDFDASGAQEQASMEVEPPLDAAVGICARSIAWHLHPVAGAGWIDPGRHACGARTYDLRTHEVSAGAWA